MQINLADIRTFIHIVTRKTGTPVHDEDLEQDIALRAVEAFQRIDSVIHPKALLMKIVRDTVQDHWRRRRPADPANDIDERFAAQIPELESEVDHRRRVELLRRAMAQLPASKRTVIELFYIQDRSIPEIAQMQSRSVSAVKMDLVRSRRSLQRIVHSSASKSRTNRDKRDK
jgi:RNA polymerase sigma factor (sigma-70 family)